MQPKKSIKTSAEPANVVLFIKNKSIRTSKTENPDLPSDNQDLCHITSKHYEL